MQAKFKKEISRFYGDSVVVGCGDTWLNKLTDIENKFHERLSYHSLHSNPNFFYSIDIDEKANADCVCDFSRNKGECPVELQSRFDFVLLEFLPGDVYIDEKRNIFECKPIASLMAKTSVMLILGLVPSGKGDISDSDLVCYDKKKLAALIIKGSQQVSPTLIVKSLNPDAQRLIQIHGLQLKTVEENYNQGANEQFLQDKAIEIVDRQIQRLKQEICQIASQILRSKATSLFYMQNLKKKNAKLSALREIKVQIRNKFPQTSLHSIIEDATERYPELTSGLFQHVVDDYLKVILEMEKYHQANCKETVKNLPQAVK